MGDFPNNIDVVVIGGGGGGGVNIGGGGGAGGYRSFNQIPISSTGTYPLIIGAGGGPATVGTATTFFLTPFGPIVGSGGGREEVNLVEEGPDLEDLVVLVVVLADILLLEVQVHPSHHPTVFRQQLKVMQVELLLVTRICWRWWCWCSWI